MANDQQPFFSVIVPLFNGAKCIQQTLDCVKKQTFQNWEVVVCDDGSTDDSVSVVKAYIKDNPQLKIHYSMQKNKGLGGARNTAIKSARGEVLALLDQDDIWYDNKLKEVYQVFEVHPEIDYVGHHEAVKKNGKTIRLAKYGPISSDFFRSLLFERNCLSTSTSCFKKDVVAKLGYFSEDRDNLHFVEDYDLWLRMAKAGCRFYIIDEVLGEYVLHDDNCSVTSIGLMYNHEIRAIRKHFALLPRKKIGDCFGFVIRIAKVCLAQLLAKVRCTHKS